MKENDQPTIPASEAFNAIVDAMGALVQVFVRHLPEEARPSVETELRRLAITAERSGRPATAMLLNDLAAAGRTKSAGPSTTH